MGSQVGRGPATNRFLSKRCLWVTACHARPVRTTLLVLRHCLLAEMASAAGFGIFSWPNLRQAGWENLKQKHSVRKGCPADEATAMEGETHRRLSQPGLRPFRSPDARQPGRGWAPTLPVT